VYRVSEIGELGEQELGDEEIRESRWR
jgi:hypothetical protein